MHPWLRLQVTHTHHHTRSWRGRVVPCRAENRPTVGGPPVTLGDVGFPGAGLSAVASGWGLVHKGQGKGWRGPWGWRPEHSAAVVLGSLASPCAQPRAPSIKVGVGGASSLPPWA